MTATGRVRWIETAGTPAAVASCLSMGEELAAPCCQRHRTLAGSVLATVHQVTTTGEQGGLTGSDPRRAASGRWRRTPCTDPGSLGTAGRDWVALPVVATLLLAAGGATMAQSPDAGASGAPAEPLDIAYLSFAVANSYDAPMQAAAEAAAAAWRESHRVRRQQRLRRPDQAAPGRGRVGQVRRHHHSSPSMARGLVTDVQNAIAQGIKVVNIDQILGADYTTAAPRSRACPATSCSCPARWAARSAS